ncbi:MAG: ParB/RepB/Spo0J family partition protein [Hyphomonadaceae bacterium]|nr:ParB/RepB/Spo0J family partition protein [Hyphomonadaceae bacterium]
MTVIDIPLSKLIEDKDNVRAGKRRGDIGELAASIKAHGLLQSLVVKDAGGGRYAVSAGGRRLRALRMLAKAGDIAKNTPIPCRVIDADASVEASLAENIARTSLPLADEILAYAKLVQEGEGPETIAARFGVSAMHVARRLKLSRVSPRLIEALRNEEIDADQLAALAMSDDHALQEASFFNAPDWARTPEQLRAQVTRAQVRESDKLARFVGVDSYVAAGGALASDLFAEQDDDARWLCDRDKLVTLAESRLKALAEDVRGEGWAWVDIAIDGVPWTQFPERVRERRRLLDEDARADQERLLARLDETEDEAEIEAIEQRLDELAPSVWQEEEVALAGAMITIGHDGVVKIERGLVKTENVKALKKLRRAPSAPGDQDRDAAPPVAAGRLSARLLDELLAHKTLALRLEIARRPELALRLVAFTLALQSIEQREASCLDIAVRAADAERAITRSEATAALGYDEVLRDWQSRLATDAETLWVHILQADDAFALGLIAVLIAPGIDLRQAPGVSLARIALGERLCEAACLDMSAYWSATPESYFDHVRKDVLIDALKEAKPSLDRGKLEKAPKSELLGRAKRVFKQSRWLPEPLRVSAPDVVASIAAQ